MTVTITLRPRHLAVAVLALALLVPASAAMAFHVFDDVADDRFYSEPVEWAADNGITTGRTPTVFDPDGAVTRGETVTFLKRYHDNLVAPQVEGVLGDAVARLGELEAALPYAVSTFGDQLVPLTTDAAVVRSVELEALRPGLAVVTASGYFSFEAVGEDSVRCSVNDGADEVDDNRLVIAAAPVDSPRVVTDTVYQSFSSTVLFPVDAGSSTFQLVCEKLAGSDVWVGDAIVTAQFVPGR